MNNSRRLAMAGSALLTMSVLPMVTLIPTAAAVTPTFGGTIAYENGNYLLTMHPDGSGQRRLVRRFSDPSWSRNGTKIAADGYGIATMRADGTHIKRLTHNVQDYDPSWSPGGYRLVFSRRGSKGSAIFRINANGTDLTRLTNWSDVNYSPAWSPTGSKIAYDVVDEPGGGIHTMNPDGSAKKYLGGTYNNFDLSWSPDGKKLAFSGGNGVDDIYTVNVDGNGLKRLTNYGERTKHYTFPESPSWSPDGTEIVFDRTVSSGDSALFLISADGGAATRLTDWSANARRPSWRRAVPWCGGRSATIIGTDRGETLMGTKWQDVIVGAKGDDRINGRAGNDIICGNHGSDTLYGGHGDDTLYGGPGGDELYQ